MEQERRSTRIDTNNKIIKQDGISAAVTAAPSLGLLQLHNLHRLGRVGLRLKMFKRSVIDAINSCR
jgi:hypothetical protein